MRAHLYLRVSTQRQADNGVSLGRENEEGFQELKCREFCAVREWEVASVEADPISGRSMKNRPGLMAQIDRACDDKGILLVYQIWRLTRSQRDGHNISFTLHSSKAALASVTEPFDTRTAFGKAVFGMYLMLGQLQSDLTGEHVCEARKLREKQLGFSPMGLQRFGWEYDKESELLVPIPAQQATITRCLAIARDDRVSLRSIASTLTSEGHTGRRGGPVSYELVKRILNDNKTPAGPPQSGKEASE